MTMGVFDFKAIKRKLDCQEQKAEFEEKNPPVDLTKVVWSHEWGYGMAAPCGEGLSNVQNQYQSAASGLNSGASTACPLKSLAHPAWPYTGTPHAWRIKI